MVINQKLKTVVIENDNEIDTKLLKYINKMNIEYIGLTNFRSMFMVDNSSLSINRFLEEFGKEYNIICSTVFVDYDQLDLMVDLLYVLMNCDVKVNFYILNNSLIDEIKHWKKSYELEDKLLLEVLKYHNIYQWSVYESINQYKNPITIKDLD